MKVTYSDQAKAAEAYPLLKKSTKDLTDVLGPSADLVAAEWDLRQDDKGRPLYSLRISDWTGSASSSFTLDELKHSSQMHVRLYRLLGQLLQARSEKLLQELGKGEE